MVDFVHTQDGLEGILGSISMQGTLFESWEFNWRVLDAADGEQIGWNLQCSFDRPDVENPSAPRQGFGRKWFVSEGTEVTGVVFTAWLAIKQLVEHELMESFVVKVEGERVRLLDPHKRLSEVAHGSRRVPGDSNV